MYSYKNFRLLEMLGSNALKRIFQNNLVPEIREDVLCSW
jgi:hypothetical protein